MSDLERVMPQPVSLELHHETIQLLPLKVGQIPGFVRALSAVLKQVEGSEIDWLLLVGERGDEMLEAVSIASGKPRAWVDELAADEALLLAAKLVEVNADFFTRQVLPKLDNLFPPSLLGGSTSSSV